jgi:competence protein ComER
MITAFPGLGKTGAGAGSHWNPFPDILHATHLTRFLGKESFMNVGIIGLGRLGGALARGLDQFWDKGNIFGFNRSGDKGRAAAALAPRLRLLDTSAAVFDRCDIVFLWTKPEDAQALLEQQRAIIRKRNPCVVSCVTHTGFDRFCDRWAETLPNVNLAAGRGMTLVWYPVPLGEPDRRMLAEVLGAVGTVHELPRDDIPFYSALASCGPALYAVMMEAYADALSKRRGYDRELCRTLVKETMAGTIAQMEADGLDARALVERVAHPGGPSEAGSRFLYEKLPELYAEMLKRMRKW